MHQLTDLVNKDVKVKLEGGGEQVHYAMIWQDKAVK